MRKEGTAGRRPWGPTCSRGAYIAFHGRTNRRSTHCHRDSGEVRRRCAWGSPGPPRAAPPFPAFCACRRRPYGCPASITAAGAGSMRGTRDSEPRHIRTSAKCS